MDLDKLKEWFNSDEYRNELENYCEKLKESYEIKKIRFDKFEKWLEKNSFDELMNRIKNEHSDEYINKCYKDGRMPYPNNKLCFIFDYLEDRYEPVINNEIEDFLFNTIMYFFKGYYFVKIHGQGTMIRIYKDKKFFLQV